MSTTMDSDALKSAYRKITWRIMPFILLCYIVSYLDRSALGVAKLQFIGDFGLNQYIFGLLTSSFYIGYILFDAPSNLLLHKIGAPQTFMRIMVLWGITTVSMMFARNANWLFVQRILLGTFEAGFFPGVLLYLTYWFPDRLRAKATSLFIVGIPVSGIVGGAVSGPVMDGMNGWLGLRGWQWLFVVDGVPAVILGVAALFWLANKPADARFLTEAERRLVAEDLEADRRLVLEKPSTSLIQVLRDWRVWLLGTVYFSISCFTSTNQVWFPTLLKAAGAKSTTDIGWMLTAIWVLAAAGILLLSRIWDRSKERRVQFALCGLVASASYLVLVIAKDSPLMMAGLLSLSAIAGYSAFVVFWTLPSRFLDGRGAAMGIGIVTMMGSFGPLISPVIVGWAFEKTGSIYSGLAAIAVVTVLGMLLALLAIPRRRPPAVANAAPGKPVSASV